ncbi:Ulp1 family isopeptidase [Sinorhizobium fredii]|uniref:Ulp1 family isopeptidase n=1 Tax=Rhizobium fredii TaxID=380 RepID=UPI0035198B75
MDFPSTKSVHEQSDSTGPQESSPAAPSAAAATFERQLKEIGSSGGGGGAMPAAAAPQPTQSKGILRRLSKSPLYSQDAPLILGLEKALIKGGAAERTARGYVRTLRSFGQWLFANNKDPIAARLEDEDPLTADAREFIGKDNPLRLLAAIVHLRTSQSTGGVVRIAGRTEYHPYPQDAALIEEYKNEAATDPGKKDASRKDATALRSFSDYLRDNNRPGIAAGLGTSFDGDVESYRKVAGADSRIGAALARLRKSQAGAEAMESSAPQPAQSPGIAIGRDNRPLYSEDAPLISGLEGALIKGGFSKSAAEQHGGSLRSFSRWLFAKEKPSIRARLDNQSLTDGGEVLEFTGQGNPKRLVQAIDYLRTLRSTGEVPISRRAKLNPHPQNVALINPEDTVLMEPRRVDAAAAQHSASQKTGSRPEELPAEGRDQDLLLGLMDEPGPSSSLEPAARHDQAPDPGEPDRQQSPDEPMAALARSNRLPSKEVLINDEHDTAELRPAKRQRTLNNPQGVAGERQLGEIANSGGQPTPAPTHQQGTSSWETQPMLLRSGYEDVTAPHAVATYVGDAAAQHSARQRAVSRPLVLLEGYDQDLRLMVEDGPSWPDVPPEQAQDIVQAGQEPAWPTVEAAPTHSARARSNTYGGLEVSFNPNSPASFELRDNAWSPAPGFPLPFAGPVPGHHQGARQLGSPQGLSPVSAHSDDDALAWLSEELARQMQEPASPSTARAQDLYRGFEALLDPDAAELDDSAHFAPAPSARARSDTYGGLAVSFNPNSPASFELRDNAWSPAPGFPLPFAGPVPGHHQGARQLGSPQGLSPVSAHSDDDALAWLSEELARQMQEPASPSTARAQDLYRGFGALLDPDAAELDDSAHFAPAPSARARSDTYGGLAVSFNPNSPASFELRDNAWSPAPGFPPPFAGPVPGHHQGARQLGSPQGLSPVSAHSDDDALAWLSEELARQMQEPASPSTARAQDLYRGFEALLDPDAAELDDSAHFAPAPSARARSDTYGGLAVSFNPNSPASFELRDNAWSPAPGFPPPFAGPVPGHHQGARQLGSPQGLSPVSAHSDDDALAWLSEELARHMQEPASPSTARAQDLYRGFEALLDPDAAELDDSAHFAPAPSARARSDTYGGLAVSFNPNSPASFELRDNAWSPAPGFPPPFAGPVPGHHQGARQLGSPQGLSPVSAHSDDDALAWLSEELARQMQEPASPSTARAQDLYRGFGALLDPDAAELDDSAHFAPAPSARARSDTYGGLPLVDLTAPAPSPLRDDIVRRFPITSSDAQIGALNPIALSHNRGLVLEDTEWLGDEHILRDYQLQELDLQRSDSDLAARTRFVDPLEALRLRLGAESDVLRVFHRIVHDRRDNDTADFLFLPVNDASATDRGRHWSLLFVDRSNRQRPVAHHYDSYGRYNETHARQLAERLNLALEPAGMAQQQNTYDCGVFVVDGTRELVRQLAQGREPDLLNLSNVVANRQALQARLRG